MRTNYNETRISVATQLARDVQDIMADYREQEARGSVDTPGGFEHLGDVWRWMRKWDALLTEVSE